MRRRFDTAFLGCGNLGMAILSRAIASGALDPARTLVVETQPARRDQARAAGATASESVRDAADAGTLLLAVKPQSFEALARDLGALHPEHRVISVMAGWSSASIRAALGGQARVVRAMPNMPAQVGLAATAIAAGAGATAQDADAARALFAAIGTTVTVEERLIDAAVAAGGSAPAYLFLLAQAQIEAAQALGLDAQQARALTVQSMLGAATMLAQDGRSPQELRAAVTSAGGTTAAAVAVFEAGGFVPLVERAMRAARDRSAELGK